MVCALFFPCKYSNRLGSAVSRLGRVPAHPAMLVLVYGVNCHTQIKWLLALRATLGSNYFIAIACRKSRQSTILFFLENPYATCLCLELESNNADNASIYIAKVPDIYIICVYSQTIWICSLIYMFYVMSHIHYQCYVLYMPYAIVTW